MEFVVDTSVLIATERERVDMQPCNLATLQPLLRKDVVNGAVKQLLAEDIEDMAAFDERANEPTLDFEDFVKALKERGKHIDTTITRPL